MALTGVVAASVALGLGVSATQANAATKIDNTHVEVQAGDTLSSISEQTGTSVNQLVQLNHLSNPDQIFVGDKLIVTPGADNNSVSTTKSTQVNSIATQSSQSTPVQTSAKAGNVATNNQASSSTSQAVATSSNSGSGSVHDQFIAAGGTEAMWQNIVIPESGGNPNATNGQYRGLGQTNQSWGTGSVAEQTKGMIQYAISRYGSVESACQAHSENGSW